MQSLDAGIVFSVARERLGTHREQVGRLEAVDRDQGGGEEGEQWAEVPLWRLQCDADSGGPATEEERRNAMKECLRVIKEGHEDERVVEEAAKLVACLCGEATRGRATLEISFPDFVVSFALPSFADAGVGCRAWGAAKVLVQWMIQVGHDDLHKAKSIVELGCGAFPLCGLVAATLSRARRLVLTDYTQECTDHARENATRFQALKPLGPMEATHIDTALFDWADETQACAGDLLIGAAVVYEPLHATILPAAIKRSLSPGGSAIIAIHQEHSGFDSFWDCCVRAGLHIERIFGPVRVFEKSKDTLGTDSTSTVHVFRIRASVQSSQS